MPRRQPFFSPPQWWRDLRFAGCRGFFSDMSSKVPFTVGVVGHFGLAVRSPKRSAKWFQRVLGLKKEFEFDDGIAIGNDNVTIALHKGRPSPATLGHMSFHLPNMTALRKALAHLRKQKV